MKKYILKVWRNFLKYIFNNYRDIVKYVLITALAITVYAILHHFATLERGYEAVGGEIFAIFLLALLWIEPKERGRNK